MTSQSIERRNQQTPTMKDDRNGAVEELWKKDTLDESKKMMNQHN
jgi:hypothetical protein